MADLRVVPAGADAAVESFPPSPIRVVLAEDHALLRGALRLSLAAEEGIEVITDAADLPSALRHVHGDRPHVLVLDLGMVSGSSREAIGKLRTRAPETQVVLLTMDGSPLVAQHVLASGALGFVLKDRADDELVPAVRAAARGEQYVSPRVAERLHAALRRSLAEE